MCRGQVAGDEKRIQPAESREQVPVGEWQERRQPDRGRHGRCERIGRAHPARQREHHEADEQYEQEPHLEAGPRVDGGTRQTKRCLGERDAPQRHLQRDPCEVRHEQGKRLAADEAHWVRTLASEQHEAADEGEERHVERHHRTHCLWRAWQQLELPAQVEHVRHHDHGDGDEAQGIDARVAGHCPPRGDGLSRCGRRLDRCGGHWTYGNSAATFSANSATPIAPMSPAVRSRTPTVSLSISLSPITSM